MKNMVCLSGGFCLDGREWEGGRYGFLVFFADFI